MYDSSRLPLQTGATMLHRILMAAGVLAAIWGLLGAPMASHGPMTMAEIGERSQDYYVGLYVMLWGAILFPLTAVLFLMSLGAARASDCLLDGEELRIVGGKFDGFQIGWSAIAAARSKLDWQGVLNLNLGEISVPIAVAGDDDERDSLLALLQAIRTRELERSGAAAASVSVVEAHVQVSVLVCPSCGAPSAVDDVPMVRCHDCGVAVSVPEEIRARVRAARDLRRERKTADDLVEKLLNQPTASRVNGMLAAVGALGMGWLPLPVMVHLWPVVALTCAAGLVLVAITNAVIADRCAVRVMTLDFAARSATKEGAADRCRRCGAPLPCPVDGSIIVSCIYCGAENVLGVDVRDGERAARSAATSLDDALRRRSRARWRARLLVVASTVIAGVGVYHLR